MKPHVAILLLIAVVLVLIVASKSAKPSYSNSWAVEVRGGPEVANELARKHGFVNRGQVSSSSYYDIHGPYKTYQ